jgi:hypothetical protein
MSDVNSDVKARRRAMGASGDCPRVATETVLQVEYLLVAGVRT